LLYPVIILFYSLIRVPKPKATLILKQRDYNVKSFTLFTHHN